VFLGSRFPAGREFCFWAYPGLAPWAELCRPFGAGFWWGCGRGWRSVLGVLCCQFEWLRFRAWRLLIEIQVSHLSHRTRKMGHPAFFLLRVNCAEGQRRRTGVSALHELGEGRLSPLNVPRYETAVPCGAWILFSVYPGLTPWAKLCRPFGAGVLWGCRYLRPGGRSPLENLALLSAQSGRAGRPSPHHFLPVLPLERYRGGKNASSAKEASPRCVSLRIPRGSS